MALHMLEPNEQTLHGYWSRDLPPVLTIEPGDTVRMCCLDAGWGYIDPEMGTRAESIFKGRDPLKGHALCGPIEVRGAKHGMVLAVEIGEIITGKGGFNLAGGSDWDLNKKLGIHEAPMFGMGWSIDREAGTARASTGHTVRTSPFLGVLGMPPNEPGKHSTIPPRSCGGNIDCKALVTGSTLYLPIAVDGALFSAGDGHAAQGDGEVSGTAIETPIDRVDLTLLLRDDMQISTPRAKTPQGWLTLGFDKNLEKAMFTALNAMLDLLMEQYHVTRKEATALASVVVDLRITQIVNDGYGVHALLPDGALS